MRTTGTGTRKQADVSPIVGGRGLDDEAGGRTRSVSLARQAPVLQRRSTNGDFAGRLQKARMGVVVFPADLGFTPPGVERGGI